MTASEAINAPFTKNDFKIDLRSQSLTCPAGEVEQFESGEASSSTQKPAGPVSWRSKCTQAASSKDRTSQSAPTKVEQKDFRKLQDTQVGSRPNVRKDRKPVKDAGAEDKLVGTALGFVRGELARLVPLCENEELAHFRTVREIHESEHRTTRMKDQWVVSTAVVFTRKINGIDVVGAGSKVMVLLANDDSVVGFDVDWSEFEDVGVLENTVDLPEIKARSYAATLEAKDRANSTLTRFECGYFDVGSRRADPNAFLQPACVSHLRTKKSDARSGNSTEFLEVIAEVTPAGERPERDAAWVELESVGQ